MSRRLALLAAFLVVAVAGMTVLLILDPWGGLPTRSVALPTPLPSGFGIPGGEIVLRADGVGELTYGATSAEALSVMHGLIGDPGEDLEQPCTDEGTRTVRFLGWGNLSLLVEEDSFVGFVTGIYFPPIGPELDLRTEEGLRLRMTDDELTAIYGDRVQIASMDTSGEAQVSVFGIDDYQPTEGGAARGIGGFLEHLEERTQVIALNGGLVC